MDRHNGQRSHIVADTISRVLAKHGLEDEVTEEVMAELEAIRLVSYQRKGVLPLLSVAGRVLVMVMEHPDMTMREIAIRMGTVESNVSRAITALVKCGLISRTRVGRNNHYKTNTATVLEHPDVWRLLEAVDSRFAAESAPKRM